MCKKKDKPKRHHWVPQVYLKSWCFNNKSIYEFHKDKLYESKVSNIESILHRKHLYSKKINDIYIIDEDKWNAEFGHIFKDLIIKFNESNLISVKDYVGYFNDFDSWDIRERSSPISKTKRNTIKHNIQVWFDVEIENLLDKEADDYWGDILKIITDKIIGSKTKLKYPYGKDLFARIVTLQYFRNPNPKTIDFNNILDGLNLPIPEEYFKVIKRDMWLKQLENFLKRNKENVVSKFYNELLKLNYIFFVARKGSFLVSDNPSSIIIDEKGLNGFYYPITPKVLLFLSRNSSQTNKYTIIDIELEQVKFINDLIVKFCHECVYSNTDNIRDIINTTITKNELLNDVNNDLVELGVIIGD